jgi:hypothetical protein
VLAALVMLVLACRAFAVEPWVGLDAEGTAGFLGGWSLGGEAGATAGLPWISQARGTFALAFGEDLGDPVVVLEPAFEWAWPARLPGQGNILGPYARASWLTWWDFRFSPDNWLVLGWGLTAHHGRWARDAWQVEGSLGAEWPLGFQVPLPTGRVRVRLPSGLTLGALGSARTIGITVGYRWLPLAPPPSTP